MMKMPSNHQCIHEERFANLESTQAKLQARLESKKEDIHSINKELYTDRKQQMELIEKVTEVTVLLKASQEQREANNTANDKKFDDLEEKIDALTNENNELKTQVTDFIASQRSFRNTVAIGAPIIISIVVGVIFKFI